jgi:hypothetical protein
MESISDMVEKLHTQGLLILQHLYQHHVTSEKEEEQTVEEEEDVSHKKYILDILIAFK